MSEPRDVIRVPMNMRTELFKLFPDTIIVLGYFIKIDILYSLSDK